MNAVTLKLELYDDLKEKIRDLEIALENKNSLLELMDEKFKEKEQYIFKLKETLISKCIKEQNYYIRELINSEEKEAERQIEYYFNVLKQIMKEEYNNLIQVEELVAFYKLKEQSETE